MIAVTIAVGEAYQRMAALAAASVKKHLGLEPVIITDVNTHAPAFSKLALLHRFPGETILYFDADTRILRPWPWDVRKFDHHPFPVVTLDWPSAARDTDCARFKIDPGLYFSSGFWIANFSHVDVWEAAAEFALSPGYATDFKYEQTALNVAVQRAALPLTILDRRFFWVPTVGRPAPLSTWSVGLGGALDGPDRPAYDAAIKRAGG